MHSLQQCSSWRGLLLFEATEMRLVCTAHCQKCKHRMKLGASKAHLPKGLFLRRSVFLTDSGMTAAFSLNDEIDNFRKTELVDTVADHCSSAVSWRGLLFDVALSAPPRRTDHNIWICLSYRYYRGTYNLYIVVSAHMLPHFAIFVNSLLTLYSAPTRLAAHMNQLH